MLGFPDSSVGKESTCNAGDPGLISGLGRSPGEGIGYPLQYSGLENSMDCIVHGVTKSQTWLSNFHFSLLFPECQALGKWSHHLGYLGHEGLFLYSSSMYYWHLLLISSASVRFMPFLSFIEPIFAWNIPFVSNFLEEIPSFSHSVVFLYFFALITEEGFLVSPCYSSELCIQMGIPFLFSFAFCFSSFHSYL